MNARAMTTREAIEIAARHMKGLAGHEFDVLTLAKPVSPDAAVNLAKIISKLSPLLGNLIEFNTCEYLSDKPEFEGRGKWRRQDPGFPDAIFDGDVQPVPGFEIKTWFPLATEITARFKDSQNHFRDDRTYVAMLAWLPERLIFGKPYILDVVVVFHREIEAFKTRVLGTSVNGMTVRDWCRVFASGRDDRIRRALQQHLGITEADAERLRQ
jgi:hypothetical protein